MSKRIASVVTILTLGTLLCITLYGSKDDPAGPIMLTVHEWGTFTTVADMNGRAMQWLPLSGPADLPCFVNHFDLVSGGKTLGPLGVPLSYSAARGQLLGSVRMETPVLYFYSSRPEVLQVKVDFPQGLVTEWYPPARVTPTLVQRNALTSSSKTNASITWDNVEVLPFAKVSSYIRGSAPSHYYAARETDAAPIRFGQDYYEKFLFYRGVGDFAVPINVTVVDHGKILVKYINGKPSVILFESRAGKMGYRVIDTSRTEALLDPPALTGNFEQLRSELESVLVGQGLYAKEAKAMIETWRDSWFEEGTRLFYIVPPKMVDTILPLTIKPKPAHVARVFVGRVEILTPTTIRAVENAIASGDRETLATYGRFLGPITERIQPTKGVADMLDAALKAYVNRTAGCSY